MPDPLKRLSNKLDQLMIYVNQVCHEIFISKDFRFCLALWRE
jgi:hypothetical protein